MSSLSVYTEILKGSFRPVSVTPGTVTLRFVRYFSSILYGCLAPDGTSNVMTRTGPASLLFTGAGVASVDGGPMASESSRVMFGDVVVSGVGAGGLVDASLGAVVAKGAAECVESELVVA